MTIWYLASLWASKKKLYIFIFITCFWRVDLIENLKIDFWRLASDNRFFNDFFFRLGKVRLE